MYRQVLVVTAEEDFQTVADNIRNSELAQQYEIGVNATPKMGTDTTKLGSIAIYQCREQLRLDKSIWDVKYLVGTCVMAEEFTFNQVIQSPLDVVPTISEDLDTTSLAADVE